MFNVGRFLKDTFLCLFVGPLTPGEINQSSTSVVSVIKNHNHGFDIER